MRAQPKLKTKHTKSNKSGLVEVKDAQAGTEALVSAENNDRMVIYNAIAEKNGSSVQEVEHIYAKRLQADAPAGTPIEGDSGWSVK